MEWLQLEVTSDELQEFPESNDNLPQLDSSVQNTSFFTKDHFSNNLDKFNTVQQSNKCCKAYDTPNKLSKSCLKSAPIIKQSQNTDSHRIVQDPRPLAVIPAHNNIESTPWKRRPDSEKNSYNRLVQNRRQKTSIPISKHQDRRRYQQNPLPHTTSKRDRSGSTLNHDRIHPRVNRLHKESPTRPLKSKTRKLLSVQTHASADILKNITEIRRKLGLL
jgi:hypothetical protein